MRIILQCSCGQQCRVDTTFPNKAVLCLRCKQTLHVPRMGLMEAPGQNRPALNPPQPNRRLWMPLVAAASVLCVAGGLMFVIVAIKRQPTIEIVTKKGNTAKSNNNQKHVRNPVRDAKSRVSSPPLTRPKKKIVASKTPKEKKPIPKPEITNPPKKPENRAPMVRIEKVNLATPRASDELRIDVAASDPDGDAVAIEYRTSENAKWSIVTGDAIKIGPLAAGSLMIELRATDEKKAVSKIVRRSWTVKPANRRPTIIGIDVLPASPMDNGVLTVRLQGDDADGDQLSFSYRQSGQEKWTLLKNDRVTLPDLTGRKISIEFRTRDNAGLTSKPIRIKWEALVRRPWQQFKVGDQVFQLIVVTHQPKYQISGINVTAGFQYTVLSRFVVNKVATDGSIVLNQMIEAARLNSADAMTRPLIAGPVAKLVGAKFRVSLTPTREVSKFDGFANQPIVAANKIFGGQALQMASLLDKDGWKELIQASFFLPDRPLVRGAKWLKKMTHSWGPLGRWDGTVAFLHTGHKNNLHQINYGFQMIYRPPLKGAANAMPFQLVNAQFKPNRAVGEIVFDHSTGRVVSVEENFQVQGKLTMKLLGQNTPVLLQEEQTFQIRMFSQRPKKMEIPAMVR